MIDTEANRAQRKWGKREQAGRVLWSLATPLFRWSPRPLWRWRRMLLRAFGARVGHQVHVYPSVKIAIPWNLEIDDLAGIGDGAILYALGRIEIGRSATISQGAHLCAGTHDYRDPAMPLIKSSISIGDEAWVCADAFIGPDVVIGEGAIVGARAVAMRDVPERVIVAGNPAQPIGRRD